MAQERPYVPPLGLDRPLDVILTVIECLKYATTGELPKNSDKGKSFVHDLKIAGQHAVTGRITLGFRDIHQTRCRTTRLFSVEAKMGRAADRFTTLDTNFQYMEGQSERNISMRTGEMKTAMIERLGVSEVILENLKAKFDAIFAATRYSKALVEMKKIRREQSTQSRISEERMIRAKSFRDLAAETRNIISQLDSERGQISASVDTLNSDILHREKELAEAESAARELGALCQTLARRRDQAQQREADVRILETEARGDQTQLTDEELAREIRTLESSDLAAQTPDMIQRSITALEQTLSAAQAATARIQHFGHQLASLNTAAAQRAALADLLPSDVRPEVEALPLAGLDSLPQLLAALDPLLTRQESSLRTFIDTMHRDATALAQTVAVQENIQQAAQRAASAATRQVAALRQELADEESRSASLDASPLVQLERQREDIDAQLKALDFEHRQSALALERAALQRRLTEAEKDLQLGSRRAALVEQERRLASQIAENSRELQDAIACSSTSILGSALALPAPGENGPSEADILTALAACRGVVREATSQSQTHTAHQATLQADVTRLETTLAGVQSRLAELLAALAPGILSPMTLAEVPGLRSPPEPDAPSDSLVAWAEGLDLASALASHRSRLQLLRGLDAIEKSMRAFALGEEGAPVRHDCPLCTRPFDQGSSPEDVMSASVEDYLSTLRRSLAVSDEQSQHLQVRLLLRSIGELETLLSRQGDLLRELHQASTLRAELSDQRRALSAAEDAARTAAARCNTLAKPLASLEAVVARVQAPGPQGMQHLLSERRSLLEQIEQIGPVASQADAEASVADCKAGQDHLDAQLEDLRTQHQAFLSQKERLMDQIAAERAVASPSASADRRRALRQQIQTLQESATTHEAEAQAAAQSISEAQRRLQEHRRSSESERDRRQASHRQLAAGVADLRALLGRAREHRSRLARLATDAQSDIAGFHARGLMGDSPVPDAGDPSTLRDVLENTVLPRLAASQADAARQRETLRSAESHASRLSLLRIWRQRRQQLVTARQDTAELLAGARDLEAEIRRKSLALRVPLIATGPTLRPDDANPDAGPGALRREVLSLKEQRGRQAGILQELARQRADREAYLGRPEIAGADDAYKKFLLEFRAYELCQRDLDHYGRTIDASIARFHALKMREINRIIADLWASTYTGEDIELIEIQAISERPAGAATDAADQLDSCHYRLVMYRNGVALDMRGRCSAGQKVLASIIVRLALAEAFGLNCGVLVLDEPTTNLDERNVTALAEALERLITERRAQNNFQLVLITHDENFLELLGRSHISQYYRVSKTLTGSVIDRHTVN
ncbi:DNA repair protein RAD50 [Fonticula alba]|uniref:DNA repair protein RAD50 n=1 Tax=Fonticula alba TaxID=691883 RepID=A0A058ZBF4_FONAL|nr:DNA repair protein RAD50 [Fonticula alba]KCV70757.1 DNA repair protein RAD50 [Fonticula alba]|eukprot:XP_009495273.1 DNA repair protein RAD50 [Fonticula alba]